MTCPEEKKLMATKTFPSLINCSISINFFLLLTIRNQQQYLIPFKLPSKPVHMIPVS